MYASQTNTHAHTHKRSQMRTRVYMYVHDAYVQMDACLYLYISLIFDYYLVLVLYGNIS